MDKEEVVEIVEKLLVVVDKEEVVEIVDIVVVVVVEVCPAISKRSSTLHFLIVPFWLMII